MQLFLVRHSSWSMDMLHASNNAPTSAPAPTPAPAPAAPAQIPAICPLYRHDTPTGRRYDCAWWAAPEQTAAHLKTQSDSSCTGGVWGRKTDMAGYDNLASDFRGNATFASLPRILPGLECSSSFTLEGTHVLQVTSCRCISHPKSGGGEDRAALATGSRRMLMLQLSDGLTEIRAIEYETIPHLDMRKLGYGAKLIVTGCPIVHRGILLLKPDHVPKILAEVKVETTDGADASDPPPPSENVRPAAPQAAAPPPNPNFKHEKDEPWKREAVKADVVMKAIDLQALKAEEGSVIEIGDDLEELDFEEPSPPLAPSMSQTYLTTREGGVGDTPSHLVDHSTGFFGFVWDCHRISSTSGYSGCRTDDRSKEVKLILGGGMQSVTARCSAKILEEQLISVFRQFQTAGPPPTLSDEWLVACRLVIGTFELVSAGDWQVKSITGLTPEVSSNDAKPQQKKASARIKINRISKGGGSGVQTQQQFQYRPSSSSDMIDSITPEEPSLSQSEGRVKKVAPPISPIVGRPCATLWSPSDEAAASALKPKQRRNSRDAPPIQSNLNSWKLNRIFRSPNATADDCDDPIDVDDD